MSGPANSGMPRGVDPPGHPMPTLDLSSFLDKVASELRPGQLLHTENFDLFQAMAAVVIGDPKMDAGAQRAQVPIDELLEGPAAPEKLTGPQLLGVMDRLAACEATWHSGHSLAQTVATCFYILRLERTTAHPILHVYCLAVKAFSNLVRSVILEAMVSQEEDFLAHTMGLPMEDLGGETPSSCMSQLESIEEALLSTSESTLAPSRLGCYTVDLPLVEAFVSRLRFRRLLLKSLDALKRGGAAHADAAARMLTSAESELKVIKETQVLGDADCPGFDADVNLALLAPRPPSHVELKSCKDAQESFAELVHHLRDACSVTSVSSLPDLRTFLARYASTNPGPIARSVLHLLATKVPEGGQKKTGGGAPHLNYQPSRRMLLDDLGFGADPVPLPDALFPVVDRMVEAVRNWVRVMCHNPSVRRRKLRRTVEDWAVLHETAARMDMTGMPQACLRRSGGCWDSSGPERGNSADVVGPLSTWAEVEATRAMLSHLNLGWELDLYGPREFSMLYWYSDYLLDVVISGMQLLFEARPPPGSHLKVGKKGKNSSAKEVAACAEALNRDSLQTQVLEVRRSTCQAMVRLLAGLRLAKLMPQDDDIFNTEQERFEQRFSFLHTLAKPEPLWHQHYLQAMSTGASTPADMLGFAEECYMHGRNLAHALLPEARVWRESGIESELTALQRVAQHNVVAIQVLKKLMSKSPRVKISWEFNQHPHFPVMGIKQQ